MKMHPMAPASDRHMTEEQIEQYSLGEAPEGELAVWEEHLLICGRCRRHVQESDVYVAAMQAAAWSFYIFH